MLIFGEWQLAHVLSEYENHYNPHRAPEQLPPIADVDIGAEGDRAAERTENLGGLIN